MVNKLICFCSTNKQELRWDTSVFQLGLIIQKMLQAVQNISRSGCSEYKCHDDVPRSFIENVSSVICIGYRPVDDEYGIALLSWKVLMYTHGSESVWP